MFRMFRNRLRRGRLAIFGVVIAAFLVSATAATVFNHQGNTGAQVAEAAGRVNRQVDDTQDAFTDIKELIPEEERLEAAPATSYAGQRANYGNGMLLADRLGVRRCHISVVTPAPRAASNRPTSSSPIHPKRWPKTTLSTALAT